MQQGCPCAKWTGLKMVQLTLPKNSTYKAGKTWNKPSGAGRWKEFQIYRWNPDDKDVDPRGCAALVMQFLHENGLDSGDILHAHMRVMSFIHDHLGDLLNMPPKPTNLVVVADAFRTDLETGKTTHQEIVKRV